MAERVVALRRWLTDIRLILPVTFVVMSVVSLGSTILGPFSIGHRWDWDIGLGSDNLARMAYYNTQVWSARTFGGLDFRSITVLFGFLVSSPGLIGIPGWAMSRILIVSTVFASGIFSFLLNRQIIAEIAPRLPLQERAFGAICGALYFASSPFLFNYIVDGATLQWLAYASGPAALYFFGRGTSQELKSADLLGSSLFLTIMLPSFQGFTLVSVAMLMISAFSRGNLRRRRFQALGYVVLMTLALNLYWILPFLSNSNLLSSVYLHADPGSILGYYLSTYASTPVNALLAVTTPSPESNPYLASSYPGWDIISIGIISFLTAVALYVGRFKTIPWLLLYTVSAIVSTGTKTPLAPLVIAFYSVIGIFQYVFLGPFQFLYITTVCLSLFISISSGFIALSLRSLESLRTLKAGVKRLISFSPLFLVLLFILPFYGGDIGGWVFKYSESPAYLTAQQLVSSDPGAYRMIYFPMSYGVSFLETPYQESTGNVTGNDPIVLWPPKPTILTNSGDPTTIRVASIIETLMEGYGNDYSSYLVDMAGAKYFMVRKDVTMPLGRFAWEYWNTSRISSRLAELQFEKTFDTYELELWKNPKALPVVYATTNFNSVPSSNIGLLGALGGIQDSRAIFEFGSRKDESGNSVTIANVNVTSFSSTEGFEIQTFESSGWRNWYLSDRYPMMVSSVTNASVTYDLNLITQGFYDLFAKTNADPWVGGLRYVLDGVPSAMVSTNFTAVHFPYVYLGSTFLLAGNHSLMIVSLSNAVRQLHDIVLVAEKGIVNLSPQISTTKLSETGYAVEVKGASVPFYLVFSEAYDTAWQLTGGTTKAFIHGKANGFGNYWLVDLLGDYRLDLAYSTQKAFELGLALDGIFLLLITPVIYHRTFRSKFSRFVFFHSEKRGARRRALGTIAEHGIYQTFQASLRSSDKSARVQRQDLRHRR